MFETVIFDWDGTLADTKEAIFTSFHAALHEVVNLDISDQFIERRIGVGAAWTFKEILDSKGIHYNEQTIEHLIEVKIRVAVENSDKVTLFPGAKDLLNSLNGKVRMGLASMNNRQVIDYLISALDVKKFFKVVITADEVNKTKPNPEIFLKTAQKLGSNPKNCVVLEDSIFGVKAAKAGHMSCIAVAQGAYSKAELKKVNPDLIVNSFAEKTSILEFILEQAPF